jgi:hypothetical protein
MRRKDKKTNPKRICKINGNIIFIFMQNRQQNQIPLMFDNLFDNSTLRFSYCIGKNKGLGVN